MANNERQIIAGIISDPFWMPRLGLSQDDFQDGTAGDAWAAILINPGDPIAALCDARLPYDKIILWESPVTTQILPHLAREVKAASIDRQRRRLQDSIDKDESLSPSEKINELRRSLDSVETEEQESRSLRLRTLNVPPTETMWVIDKLVPEDGCVIVAAEEKTGKTWLTFEMAIAVANRRRVLRNHAAHRHGPVLIYSPESGWNARTQRLWGLCWGKGLDPREATKEIYFIDQRIDMADKKSVGKLRSTITEIQPALLILDPLISCSSGMDENSSGETMVVLDAIRDLTQSNPGMGTIVCHHLGKMQKDKSSFHKMRGSTAIGAWADGLISITKKDELRIVNVSHRDAVSPPPCAFAIESYCHREGENDQTTGSEYILMPRDIAHGAGRIGGDSPELVSILEYLSSHQGSTPAQIGTALSRERTAVHHQVSRLVVSGKVKKEPGGRIYTII